MISYTRKVLPNGLRVIQAPMHETDAVTVLAMFKVGSRYERLPENGVSHFLEHMMFKGTEKRPTARDVALELDKVGADFNAFTSKDYTGYYVKLRSEHLDLALDLIADMLWRSKFLPQEVEKERKVIMEEINMYFDNPAYYIEDLFEELLFSKAHPLGRLISGPKSVISRMKRDMVVDYFHRHYFPANMALAVAGHFAPAMAERLIAKQFGSVTHRRTPTSFPRFRVTQKAPRAAVHFRETEQVQLTLGFPALPYGHKDLAALGLLTVILGGNMSSRLFTRVREEHGLAYHVSASRHPYQDTGVFAVRSGLDRTRILPATSLILDVLADAKKGVTRDELANAKDFVQGKLTLQLEDSEQIANFYCSQEILTGTIATPETRMREVQAVTRADVARVARAVLRPERLNLALIGPFRQPAPFLKVMKGFT